MGTATGMGRGRIVYERTECARQVVGRVAGDLGECIWKVRGPGDGVIPGLGGGGRDYSCRYRYRKLQLKLGLQP